MARKANPKSTKLTIDLGSQKVTVLKRAKSLDMSASALVRRAVEAFMGSGEGQR